MNVAVEALEGGRAVLRPEGRLDLVVAAAFRDAVRVAVEAGHRSLVIDLAGVPVIDSSGIGALIGGLRETRQAGGELRIAAAGEQIRTVLGLTKIDRVLKPYASVDEALDGL
jgi:anti-anti-sigma factor